MSKRKRSQNKLFWLFCFILNIGKVTASIEESSLQTDVHKKNSVSVSKRNFFWNERICLCRAMAPLEAFCLQAFKPQKDRNR